MKKQNKIFNRIICLTLVFILAFPVLFTAGVNASYTAPATANPGVYAPRTDEESRPAYLHGTFNQKTGAGIAVYDDSGKREVIALDGANWDGILMDCVSSSWGYFRITLYLPAGEYEFKVEQKNSGGMGDYWYGLDGYRYDSGKWPYVDIYNNYWDDNGNDYGNKEFNNIHINLTESDDVTFYFVDGDRAPDFDEYNPPPPWYTINNAKLHYIAASPEKPANIYINGIGGEKKDCMTISVIISVGM